MAASASGSESDSDMAEADWTAKFGAFTYHGGALEVARRLAPRAPEPWIDLSTGVNPHAYPLPPLAPEAWSRLPESEALAKLEAAAARRYGAAAESVIAGPGSQALIQALAHILPAGEAGALGRTYGGFAAAFAPRRAGGRSQATRGHGPPRRRHRGQPQQPGRAARSRGELLALHERLARRGALLIVDEAFADFDGEESLAVALPARSAVILRSFGKAYGLAGLRLGFALASPDIVPALRAALGPWPVSGPAIAIGVRALGDSDWLAPMRARIGKDRARLDALLHGAGWRIIGGTRLFRLAAHGDARAAFERLLAAGILARPFADAPDRLRFGMPGDEYAWERLTTVLRG